MVRLLINRPADLPLFSHRAAKSASLSAVFRRREFFKVSIGALAASCLGTHAGLPQSVVAPGKTIRDFFLQILVGFLKSAAATSPEYTVCDFPGGTKLKGCCTPSGKTYVSVARMLPAMAEWIAGGHDRVIEVDGKSVNLERVLLSIYRTAFDPAHPDYWGEPPASKLTQRSVEAALVAWALVRLGPPLVDQLADLHRKQINRWLASCTRVPERNNNHAWFTAINQAARLELSSRYQEFQGDESWMLEDLKALDALHQPNNDGWYSDSPEVPVYDYYNFWVFANFPLYWGQVIGDRYPDWNTRFRDRVAEFLQKTPFFFARDGGHPLYGRSLIYRWAILSPLVAAYREGLWPHAPGLLRRIVRKSLQFHWTLGAFDAAHGNLRETYSAEGSPNLKEHYIDNGHPYWCMQAFSILGLPDDDPFWLVPEEPLPVEQGDFAMRFEGTRMMLVGIRRTGEVKWVQAWPGTRRDYYRDKYMKFVYSCHFPCNVAEVDGRQVKGACPQDQMLVFRDPATGVTAGRTRVEHGELLADGVRTTYAVELARLRFLVTSRIRFAGEFESHQHEILAPSEAIGRAIEILEGSYPLGLVHDEDCERAEKDGCLWMRSGRSGSLVAVWGLAGFDESTLEEVPGLNLTHPRSAVITLKARVNVRKLTLTSLHYASLGPEGEGEILRRARELSADLHPR